mmetsp:Transcript_4628/g.11437  ORF Transcript_4628/g.11437 Transcript_4628/m.11437 type:complete len:228 (-) Transcript_4628:1126-1809(-)
MSWATGVLRTENTLPWAWWMRRSWPATSSGVTRSRGHCSACPSRSCTCAEAPPQSLCSAPCSSSPANRWRCVATSVSPHFIWPRTHCRPNALASRSTVDGMPTSVSSSTLRGTASSLVAVAVALDVEPTDRTGPLMSSTMMNSMRIMMRSSLLIVLGGPRRLCFLRSRTRGPGSSTASCRVGCGLRSGARPRATTRRSGSCDRWMQAGRGAAAGRPSSCDTCRLATP